VENKSENKIYNFLHTVPQKIPIMNSLKE